MFSFAAINSALSVAWIRILKVKISDTFTASKPLIDLQTGICVIDT
jgi:hypothetical protein